MGVIKNNLFFLVGGRATGKTTVGKLLSQSLTTDFLDMDTVIVERDGRSIQQMVAEQGWPFFRNLEKTVLKELILRKNLVVATGGGAILHQNIWPRVMETALVIWLFADIETVAARLRNDPLSSGQRPSLTGADFISETEKIMAEREPLYRQGSHLHIESNQPVEMIVATIEAACQNNYHKSRNNG